MGAKLFGAAVRRREDPRLLTGQGRYVGETVALVVAESRPVAESAAEAIEVSYEPLPAITDPVAAAEADAPRLYADWDDNVALAFDHTLGQPDAAFEQADILMRERF